MPPWLWLVVAIGGCILWTGLLAVGVTGRWRTFGEAVRTFTLFLLVLSLPGILVLAWLFIFAS